jgi:Tfp pilus assembly protein PilO
MNASVKRIFGLAGLAALVLVVAWYLAVFSPQARNLSKAHKAHTAAEQKISQLQGQLVQLNALKAQIPADKAALSTLDAAVPSSPQLDSTLRQIQQAASASGVSLSSLSPSAPITTGSTTAPKTSSTPSIVLTMSATGSYSEIAGYLTQLAGMPRTVVVTGLNIAGTGAGLTAQITANIFYTGA